MKKAANNSGLNTLILLGSLVNRQDWIFLVLKAWKLLVFLRIWIVDNQDINGLFRV